MKRTTIVLLVLALAMLLSACSGLGVAPTSQENIPSNLEKGNNYNADMDNLNNTNESTARVWPWEDPSIVLPPFTGNVTPAGSIKSLKILVVGDRSAKDAWYFFPQLAKEAGIELKLVVLYSNGNKGDITNHYSTGTTYTQYEYTANGWETISTSAKQNAVLKSDKWDYYVINHSIANSGKLDTYSTLNYIFSTVKLEQAKIGNGNVKTLFMQTWTYEINDRNNLYNGFSGYGKDQQKMFREINNAAKLKAAVCSNISKVATNANSDGVIPVGTAIQNMREAYWSDGMTRDAEYLSNTGKVVAALMLFKSITGYDINSMKMSDSVFDHARPHFGVIKESVNNAYLTPYATTTSVYHMD